ncbi:hypothetical protein [Nocardia xishanensis]
MNTEWALPAAMDTLAVDTWERLEAGTPLGLDPGEEAITNYLLYELRRRYLPSTLIRNTDGPQVRKLNKAQESKIGADWNGGSATRTTAGCACECKPNGVMA